MIMAWRAAGLARRVLGRCGSRMMVAAKLAAEKVLDLSEVLERATSGAKASRVFSRLRHD